MSDGRKDGEETKLNVVNLDAVKKAKEDKVAKKLRVFTNYELIQQGKYQEAVALPPNQLVAELKEIGAGWPKMCGGIMYAPAADDSQRLMPLDGPNELFAWISTLGVTVAWDARCSGAQTKPEFYAAVKMSPPVYGGLEIMPHYPPLDGVYYHLPPITPGTASLDEFVSFFKPATEFDRELFKALILTMFWGGEGGQRPAFVITGESEEESGGRGSGKSSMTEIISSLCGANVITFTKAFDSEVVSKRLLTSTFQRLVRIDNVKSDVYSNADLESTITTRHISGHRMYIGLGEAINKFTYILTFNGANFSHDMSQRVIQIKLERPEHANEWNVAIKNYLDQKRLEVVADIGRIFSSPPLSCPRGLRFAPWAAEVLGRVTARPDAIARIKGAQQATNEEVAFAKRVSEVIVQRLGEYQREDNLSGSLAPMDPLGDVFVIKKGLVYEWIKGDLDLKNLSSIALSKKVSRARPEYIQGGCYYDNFPCFVWHQPQARFLAPDGTTTGRPAQGWLVKQNSAYRPVIGTITINWNTPDSHHRSVGQKSKDQESVDLK